MLHTNSGLTIRTTNTESKLNNKNVRNLLHVKISKLVPEKKAVIFLYVVPRGKIRYITTE